MQIFTLQGILVTYTAYEGCIPFLFKGGNTESLHQQTTLSEATGDVVLGASLGSPGWGKPEGAWQRVEPQLIFLWWGNPAVSVLLWIQGSPVAKMQTDHRYDVLPSRAQIQLWIALPQYCLNRVLTVLVRVSNAKNLLVEPETRSYSFLPKLESADEEL